MHLTEKRRGFKLLYKAFSRILRAQKLIEEAIEIQQEVLAMLDTKESSAGPEKPTTPTSGNT